MLRSILNFVFGDPLANLKADLKEAEEWRAFYDREATKNADLAVQADRARLMGLLEIESLGREVHHLKHDLDEERKAHQEALQQVDFSLHVDKGRRDLIAELQNQAIAHESTMRTLRAELETANKVEDERVKEIAYLRENLDDLATWQRKASEKYDALEIAKDQMETAKIAAEHARYKMEVQLIDTEKENDGLQGYIDACDNNVSDALTSIGKFPPKPAGMPDRLDVLIAFAKEARTDIDRLFVANNRLVDFVADCLGCIDPDCYPHTFKAGCEAIGLSSPIVRKAKAS